MRILVINPGSTSSKLALYEGEHLLAQESIEYGREQLAACANLYEQLEFRNRDLRAFLARQGQAPADLSAIAARGGMLPPLAAGAYEVDATLAHILRHEPAGIHASNLAGLMAYDLSQSYGIPAYIYDAVSVDEMMAEARPSGVKEWPRKAFSHALNTRAVALRHAQEQQEVYEESCYIVAHLGGGISLNIQSKGRMIDTVAGQEGPFSTERAGALDVFDCASICEQHGVDYLRKLQSGTGGFVSYFGTNKALEINQRALAGDSEAVLLRAAMALQVAKYIGLLAVDVAGKVDAILLTGGVAHWQELCAQIKARVEFIAPVYVYAGEFEMQALAQGILRVLEGQEIAHRYEK